MAWFRKRSGRCTAYVRILTSTLLPLVQICVVISGDNVERVRDQLAERLRDSLGIPSGGTRAPDGGQLYVMAGGDLRVIAIEHPDPEGGAAQLRSTVLAAIERLDLVVEHLPDGDIDAFIRRVVAEDRERDSQVTDTPNMYTWCFDHGELHAVPVGTEPWCTGFWVFLTGMNENEAMADKQTHYGEARYLNELSPEVRDRLIEEYSQ